MLGVQIQHCKTSGNDICRNIQECYAMALFGLGDPALAINHLGQGMYIYLQVRLSFLVDKTAEDLIAHKSYWLYVIILQLLHLMTSLAHDT